MAFKRFHYDRNLLGDESMTKNCSNVFLIYFLKIYVQHNFVGIALEWAFKEKDLINQKGIPSWKNTILTPVASDVEELAKKKETQKRNFCTVYKCSMVQWCTFGQLQITKGHFPDCLVNVVKDKKKLLLYLFPK